MNFFQISGTFLASLLAVSNVNSRVFAADAYLPLIGSSDVEAEESSYLDDLSSDLPTSQNDPRLASHGYSILLVNSSSFTVTYYLNNTEFQLASGEYREHTFYVYGDGDRSIDFDYTLALGWQNRRYNLSLGSSYIFADTGVASVDLF